MTRALSLVALLATPMMLSACNTAPAQQDAARPAPTGITAGRGGGAQALGNTGTGNPIAVTPTTPVR